MMPMKAEDLTFSSFFAPHLSGVTEPKRNESTHDVFHRADLEASVGLTGNSVRRRRLSDNVVFTLLLTF